MNPRILLVEDEAAVLFLVSDLLESAGYVVETADDGRRGLQMALDQPFDLLILDVMLPGMNGFEICHAVRERGFDGAVLLLTARGEVPDRVQGLRGGADDYLVKPFDADELLARVGALLRRVRKAQLTPVSQFEFGSVRVDFTREEVRRNGQPVELSGKEMELLRYLVNCRGQTLSRENILHHVWRGQEFITQRTVDVHIASLRQKLEEVPGTPQHIVTARGEGYRFNK